ncbi:MAG: DUF551 domain-containing protein [Spirochaetes bacterium]|nr:MAG: DUF551 domain-containing protein [Spirochaetota bacterium]
MTKWISVKDRLPEERTVILTYSLDENSEMPICTAFYKNKNFECSHKDCIIYNITHWAELPEPPIEE